MFSVQSESEWTHYRTSIWFLNNLLEQIKEEIQHQVNLYPSKNDFGLIEVREHKWNDQWPLKIWDCNLLDSGPTKWKSTAWILLQNIFLTEKCTLFTIHLPFFAYSQRSINSFLVTKNFFSTIKWWGYPLMLSDSGWFLNAIHFIAFSSHCKLHNSICSRNTQ